MTSISQSQLTQLLILEQIPESVLDECSSIFTLIITLSSSRELLITGNNLSVLIRCLKGSGNQNTHIQEAVSILHDLDNKGYPMDIKHFPLSIIRKLKIKMFHNQSDIDNFHKNVKLFLTKQLYYDVDLLQKWDQLYFEENKAEIQSKIKQIYRQSFRQSLLMKQEFGQWLDISNKVMMLISLPTFQNDKTIIDIFEIVLNSQISNQLVEILTTVNQMIPNTILQALKALSYIYTASKYSKLQHYYKQDFILLNPELWTILVNLVDVNDLNIKRQAIVCLSVLCNYYSKFAQILYNNRFDLLARLCQLFAGFEDGHATFQALQFLRIWVLKFRKIMIEQKIEQTKGVMGSILSFAMKFFGKNIGVFEKIQAVKVVQQVLIAMKKIGKTQLLEICKLPTIFVNGDAMLIGAILQLIYGILRAQASISCEVFLSSVQFRLYLTSTIQNPAPGSHFICLTILLELSGHENSRKFLFDKEIILSLSRHTQFCNISTGKILAKLLRRMIQDSTNEQSKLFLLYQCGVIGTLIELLPKFFLPNKALNIYFQIPDNLIQDTEMLINILVSIYLLYSYDLGLAEQLNLRKIGKFRENIKQQHIDKLRQTSKLIFIQSNNFLIQKALRSEISIKKNQPIKCKFAKLIGMMMQELLLFFHDTPLSKSVKTLRRNLKLKGIYKSMSILEVQQDNIPVILSISFEYDNRIITGFRTSKISYQNFKKISLIKLKPFFDNEINNFEFKDAFNNRLITTQTDLQRSINDVLNKASNNPQLPLRIKISNLLASNISQKIPFFNNQIDLGFTTRSYNPHLNKTYNPSAQQIQPQNVKNSMFKNIGLTNSVTFRSVQPNNDNSSPVRVNPLISQGPGTYNNRYRATTPQPRIGNLKSFNMLPCPTCRTLTPQGICRYCM